jgi:hypothetical protein
LVTWLLVKNLARVVKAAITRWKEVTVSRTSRYRNSTEVPGNLRGALINQAMHHIEMHL